MRSLAINGVNDIFLARDGRLAFVTDAAAVGQNAKTAMQAQRFEMVYRYDDGMPTRQTAFDRYSPAQFEAAARAVIMRVEGVESIQSFTVDRVGNALVYTAAIQTIYGPTVVTNAI